MYLLLFREEVPGCEADGGNCRPEVVFEEGSSEEDFEPLNKYKNRNIEVVNYHHNFPP